MHHLASTNYNQEMSITWEQGKRHTAGSLLLNVAKNTVASGAIYFPNLILGIFWASNLDGFFGSLCLNLHNSGLHLGAD